MKQESPLTTKLIEHMQSVASPEKARILARFFKTGPGQYGEGDVFIGIQVPTLRAIASEYRKLVTLSDVDWLLDHQWHEVRLCALFILILMYEKALAPPQSCIELYLARLDRVNNWDLVDLSAPKLLGPWLLDKNRSLLDTLAGSGQLWRERVAVLSTFAFIRCNDFNHTLRLAQRFLNHPHDLMHKACGWMLREIGKRDLSVLRNWLDTHQSAMPRTMLRYAMEKLPEPERLARLKASRT